MSDPEPECLRFRSAKEKSCGSGSGSTTLKLRKYNDDLFCNSLLYSLQPLEIQSNILSLKIQVEPSGEEEKGELNDLQKV